MADSLYVIESGKVKVYCSDKNGKEFIMNTLSYGDYFGELALLDDDRRSASVRTMEKADFCIIYKQDFNQVLDQHPNIAKTLIKNITRRVRALTEKVKSLALQDVYGRVTKVLNSLATERNDEFYVEEKLLNKILPIVLVRRGEMVARILKDLTIGGYISFENRHIVIYRSYQLIIKIL